MQKAVAKACEDTCLQSIKWSDKWDEDAFALARKHNIKIVELSKADRQKLLELNQKNWKQIAEQSPQLAGAVALMEKYLESKKSKQSAFCSQGKPRLARRQQTIYSREMCRANEADMSIEQVQAQAHFLQAIIYQR
eukprot:TRINITY_DN126219_c0_g1_i1.p3 TRINITY_DN126219_c0_g1~~TRINITY_DN126219_c0_g1_i1.p3  ORF type:complete len:136 (+),score=26.02 TRINITY_DN126219_c0_g1_i1:3-410(+)